MICALLLLATALRSAQGAPPRVVPCPARDCLVPDVAVDSGGAVHLVYGTTRKQAFYQRSLDDGATWSAPLRLNDAHNVTTTMGERGPKLSVPSPATVYVVWLDLWFSGAQTFARMVRSTDGGATFTAPVAISEHWGIDGITLAASAQGGVLLAYHWGNATYPQPPNSTEATWLFTRASADGGASWGATALAPLRGVAPVACSMCAMRARSVGGDDFQLAFRSAVNNVREHWIVNASLAEGAGWPAARAGGSWPYPACPMNGPELEEAAAGARAGGPFSAVVAFMSGDANNVFWSGWDPAAGAFLPPVGTPGGQGSNERYPTALQSGGEVLMVWNVGPMAVEGTAEVKWALYFANGTDLARGSLGTSFAGTKATAWVDGGGGFNVMTTAK
jgi:hypothetical protein